MRCLSIKQPWSWLITTQGKDIENRAWKTPFRGPFLIHAGRGYDGGSDWWDWPGIAKPDRFDLGGIVGIAEIVGCVSESTSPWFFGPRGFVLQNARPLPFIPCPGRLGFFPAPAGVLEQLGGLV